MIIHLDYETRSRCDLPARGQWNYSVDKSTSVMCVSYAFDDGPIRSAHPAFPSAGIPAKNWPPRDLIKAVLDRSNTVHAHNSSFEKYISMNATDWLDVLPEQWRCTLSIAAYYALPRGLGKCAEALGLPVEKDMKGNAAMKRCMRPNKEGEWHEDRQDLLDMFAYCDIDVEVERAIENRLGPLPPYELAIWQFDQKMNERGIPFDRKLAEIALETVEREKAQANIDIYRITEGMVETTTARNTFFDWTEKMNYPLKGKSLDEAHREIYLADPKVPQIIKDVIELRASVGKSSVNKYKKILGELDDFGIVREGLKYCGAGTGRWTGKGVQVHNFPRGYGDEMEDICEAILEGNFGYVNFMYGDRPMNALKYATRGAILAPEGKELLVSDFSSIEARVLFWLVGDVEATDVIRNSCIYCDMASTIYGFEVTKAKNPLERGVGKTSILGLGFQMGYLTFVGALEKANIFFTEKVVKQLLGDEYAAYKGKVIKDIMNIRKRKINLKEKLNTLIGAKFIVDTYRAKYPQVTAFWKEIEATAVEAVQNPDVEIPCGKISWYFDSDLDILQMKLPSGRHVNYFKPQLKPKYALTFTVKGKTGKEAPLRVQLDELKGDELEKAKGTCKEMGVTLATEEYEIWEKVEFSYMKSLKTGFKRVSSYSGKFTENCWAGNTKVLTRRGWKKIRLINKNDTIWDGEEWVSSQGSKLMGNKRVVKWLDTLVTSDHMITDGKSWKKLREMENEFMQNALKLGRDLVPARYWRPGSPMQDSQNWSVIAGRYLEKIIDLFVVARYFSAGIVGTQKRDSLIERMQIYLGLLKYQISGLIGTRELLVDVMTPTIKRLKTTVPEVSPSTALGRTIGRYSLNTLEIISQTGQNSKPISTESTMTGDTSREISGLSQEKRTPGTGEKPSKLTSMGKKWPLSISLRPIAQSTKAIMQFLKSTKEVTPSNRFLQPTKSLHPVYDIINCGPRHKYMVLTSKGPVIVHNCVQAIARDLMAEGMVNADRAGFDISLTVHDEAVAIDDIGGGRLQEFEDQLTKLSPWAKGLPLAAESFLAKRYKK